MSEVLERVMPPNYAEQLVRRLVESDVMQRRGIIRDFFGSMGQRISESTISDYLSYPITGEVQTEPTQEVVAPLPDPVDHNRVPVSLEKPSSIAVAAHSPVTNRITASTRASVRKTMTPAPRKKRTLQNGRAPSLAVTEDAQSVSSTVGEASIEIVATTSFSNLQGEAHHEDPSVPMLETPVESITEPPLAIEQSPTETLVSEPIALVPMETEVIAAPSVQEKSVTFLSALAPGNRPHALSSSIIRKIIASVNLSESNTAEQNVALLAEEASRLAGRSLLVLDLMKIVGWLTQFPGHQSMRALCKGQHDYAVVEIVTSNVISSVAPLQLVEPIATNDATSSSHVPSVTDHAESVEVPRPEVPRRKKELGALSATEVQTKSPASKAPDSINPFAAERVAKSAVLSETDSVIANLRILAAGVDQEIHRPATIGDLQKVSKWLPKSPHTLLLRTVLSTHNPKRTLDESIAAQSFAEESAPSIIEESTVRDTQEVTESVVISSETAVLEDLAPASDVTEELVIEEQSETVEQEESLEAPESAEEHILKDTGDVPVMQEEETESSSQTADESDDTSVSSTNTQLDLEIFDDTEHGVSTTQISRGRGLFPKNEDKVPSLPAEPIRKYVPGVTILGTEKNVFMDELPSRTSLHLPFLGLGESASSAINTMLNTVGPDKLNSARIYKIVWSVTDPLRGSSEAVSADVLHDAIVQLHEMWSIPFQDAPERVLVVAHNKSKTAQTFATDPALLELERSLMHPEARKESPSTFTDRKNAYVTPVTGAEIIDLSEVESGPRDERPKNMKPPQKQKVEVKVFSHDDDLDDEFGSGSYGMDPSADWDDEDDGEGEEFVEFEQEDFAALGIDPYRPTKAKPGSEAKVLMLTARYAAGLPMWHEEDESDHGPKMQGFLQGIIE